MPESIAKIRPHPAKPVYRLQDAANDGVLIRLRCNLCHRTTHFLASDLVKVLDPQRSAAAVPFPCSRCKTIRYIDVELRSPDLQDYGLVVIRRPKAIKRRILWESVKLGDPGGL